MKRRNFLKSTAMALIIPITGFGWRDEVVSGDPWREDMISVIRRLPSSEFIVAGKWQADVIKAMSRGVIYDAGTTFRFIKR